MRLVAYFSNYFSESFLSCLYTSDRRQKQTNKQQEKKKKQLCSGNSLLTLQMYSLPFATHWGLTSRDCGGQAPCVWLPVGVSQWEAMARAWRERRKVRVLTPLAPSLLDSGLDMAAFLCQRPQLLPGTIFYTPPPINSLQDPRVPLRA